MSRVHKFLNFLQKPERIYYNSFFLHFTIKTKINFKKFYKTTFFKHYNAENFLKIIVFLISSQTF